MNSSKQVYSVHLLLLLLLRWNPIQRGIQAMPSNVIHLLQLTFLLSFCQTPSLLPLNCATPSSLVSREVGERGGRGEDGCQGLTWRSQSLPYSQIWTLIRHLSRDLKPKDGNYGVFVPKLQRFAEAQVPSHLFIFHLRGKDGCTHCDLPLFRSPPL